MGLVAPRHVGSSWTWDALAGEFLPPEKFHVHGFDKPHKFCFFTSSEGCVDILGRSICGVFKLWCYSTVMVLSPILIRITDVS